MDFGNYYTIKKVDNQYKLYLGANDFNICVYASDTLSDIYKAIDELERRFKEDYKDARGL